MLQLPVRYPQVFERELPFNLPLVWNHLTQATLLSKWFLPVTSNLTTPTSFVQPITSYILQFLTKRSPLVWQLEQSVQNSFIHFKLTGGAKVLWQLSQNNGKLILSITDGRNVSSLSNSLVQLIKQQVWFRYNTMFWTAALNRLENDIEVATKQTIT
jgi:hypothetical protein